MSIIDEAKKAFEELKQLAENAGISKEEDDMFHDEDEKPTIKTIHDRLVEFGKEIGSFRKALNIYYENCIIDEDDALQLRDTVFYDLLYKELESENFFNEKNKDSVEWDLEIID